MKTATECAVSVRVRQGDAARVHQAIVDRGGLLVRSTVQLEEHGAIVVFRVVPVVHRPWTDGMRADLRLDVRELVHQRTGALCEVSEVA